MQKKVCTKFQLPDKNTEVPREIKECQNLESFAGKGVSTSGALTKGINVLIMLPYGHCTFFHGTLESFCFAVAVCIYLKYFKKY